MFTFLFAISIWFYIFTVFFVIFAVICEETDSFVGAILLLIVYTVLIQFVADIDILRWVLKNPLHLLWIIPGYIAMGLVWSWIKWWLRVNRLAQKINEELKKFKVKENITTDSLTSAQNEKWTRQRSYSFEKPEFSKNKKKITIWVMYWPISLIWSLLNDFIKKMIDQIVIYFHKVYEGIANKAFEKIDSIKIVDIPKEEKKGLNRQS